MAEFPIYYTSRSLPGQSTQVPGRLDVRTGEGMVAQAWGDVAQAGFAFGSTEHRLAGEAELVQLSAEDKESLRRLSLKLQENTDESTYDQFFEETWSEIQGREVKNGWARQRRAMTLPALREQALKGIDNAKRQRVVENHKEAMALAEATAIQTGSLANVRALLQSEVKAGLLTENGAKAELMKIGHKAELEAFQKRALQFPEETLADLEDDKLEGAVHLDADDYLRVRNMAITARSDNEVQVERQRMGMTEELWRISQDSEAGVDDVLNYINALPDEYFDQQERDKLLRQTMSRMAIIQKGRGDPLEVRQDYGKYKELLFAANDGTVTEASIRDAVNNNQITIGDYQQLTSIMRAQQGKQADAYSLTNVLRRMERLVDASDAIDDELKETAKLKIQMVLEDRMKAAEKPLAGRDLMMAMLEVERGIEEEAESFPAPEELLPTGTMPEPRTKEEYDALPSGTHYLHPDGIVKVKS